MKRFLTILGAGWMVLLLAATGFAQEQRGSISGTVTDASGAIVPGVQITVTDVNRGVGSQTVSNEAGIYIVRFLQPGTYSVKAEMQGFKTFEQGNIKLLATERLAIDIKMEVGGSNETVSVTAAVSTLQTETATRAITVENRALESVAVNRNLYQFQYTMPGVIKTSRYIGSMELYAYGNMNGVMIAGGRGGQNETLIDGVSTTDYGSGIMLAPAVNSVNELTVQANSYDAQFGRIGGGVTMFSIKSGTNQLHGEVFETYKSDDTGANDWIANKYGESASRYLNNTFGYTVNGPVYIPKLFDGRNKFFFMSSLEGMRERGTAGQGRTMPTAEMRNGDFSKLLNASGQPVLIYDPLTTIKDASGKYVRTAFAGNRIPSNRISPISAKVAAYLPQPTGPGDGPNFRGNYYNTFPAQNGYNAWMHKFDFVFNENHRLAVRHGRNFWTNWSKVVWGNNEAEPSGEWPSTRNGQIVGFDYNWTMNQSMVFSLRGGLSRYWNFSGNEYAGGFNPAALGFPDSLVKQFTRLQFPRFENGEYTEIGASTVTSKGTTDTYSLQPNFNWVKGRHVVKFGSEMRRYNRNTVGPGVASGRYVFSKAFSQANPLTSDSTSGDEWASFMMGYPASGSVDSNIDPAYRWHYYAFYLQDDFKLSRNLTLNLGLRWDYEQSAAERFNRMVRSFDTTMASPLNSSLPSSYQLKGGIVYAGAAGVSRQAFNPDWNNFQPRLGVAWRFLPKTVLRAGYGLSNMAQGTWGPAYGYSRPTPLVASLDGGLTPAVSLSDPFPASIYPTGLLKPVGNSQGAATNLGQGVQGMYNDRPLPFSHQFSFGFQQELPKGWVADISYVGNLTRKLPVSLGLNFIPTSELLKLPVEQRSAYFTEQITNPMAGLLSGTSLNGAKLPRQQLLYAFPQYTGVTMSDVPIGRQTYHALLMQFSRRFANNYSLNATYTWSKTLEQVNVLNAQDVDLGNLLNTKLEQRLVEYDIPHKLTLMGVAQLPFGRGQRFGTDMNKVLDAVIGGWNFTCTYILQSGFILANYPNAAPLSSKSPKLNDAQRLELAKAKGHAYWDISEDWWFDRSVFPTTAQAAYTLRNFPTRFSDVRAWGWNSVEASIHKNVKMGEKLTMQIKADFQNALNHPWFGSMSTNSVTSSAFGRLNADMNNEPRRVVLTAKILF